MQTAAPAIRRCLSEDGTKLVVYGGGWGTWRRRRSRSWWWRNIGAARLGTGSGEVLGGCRGVVMVCTATARALLPGNVMMVYGGKSIAGGKKGSAPGRGEVF